MRRCWSACDAVQLNKNQGSGFSPGRQRWICLPGCVVHILACHQPASSPVLCSEARLVWAVRWLPRSSHKSSALQKAQGGVTVLGAALGASESRAPVASHERCGFNYTASALQKWHWQRLLMVRVRYLSVEPILATAKLFVPQQSTTSLPIHNMRPGRPAALILRLSSADASSIMSSQGEEEWCQSHEFGWRSKSQVTCCIIHGDLAILQACLGEFAWHSLPSTICPDVMAYGHRCDTWPQNPQPYPSAVYAVPIHPE